MSDIKERIGENENCFVCGKQNKQGLQLDFRFEDNKVFTDLRLGKRFEGYKGIIHGGLISTVLDESMAKWMEFNSVKALTAELNVRLKTPLFVGQNASVIAFCEKVERRIYCLKAEIRDQGGDLIATATSRFIHIK